MAISLGKWRLKGGSIDNDLQTTLSARTLVTNRGGGLAELVEQGCR